MISRNQIRFSQVVPKYSRRFVAFQSTAGSESTNPNFIRPESVSLDYWKKLLWVAADLKETVRKNNKHCLNLLETKHITLLFEKPHGRFQHAFSLACSLLGARKTPYFETNFENQPNPADSGKVLSQLTDMFIVHGLHHEALMKFASRATVPLFPASCNIYSFQMVLSDLMTFQEKFNRLKGLSLAWIGPPTPAFNTYLLVCPLFGIDIRYLCICVYGSGKMSPVKKCLMKRRLDEMESIKSPKELKTVEETVTGSNVIGTSMHPEEKNRINLELLKNADPNWVFIHTLPRSSVEVSDDVFYHERNISWKASENHLFIAMAVILTNLHNYQPTMSMPNFG